MTLNATDIQYDRLSQRQLFFLFPVNWVEPQSCH